MTSTPITQVKVENLQVNESIATVRLSEQSTVLLNLIKVEMSESSP